jgi:2-haloacid dehalogenase
MVQSLPAKFQAIFFDLFNTLLHFDFSRLPAVEYEGQPLPTTSVEVYERLKESFSISFSQQLFLEEFIESRRIVREMRGKEYREIPSLKRFQILMDRLKMKEESAADLVVQVHMDQMFSTMYLPDESRDVLGELSKYPLVLVSNFDHASTLHRALQKFGLEEQFEAVFVSEEVGWRKPGRKFFETVLQETQYAPEQCLYVGDDPEADVLGASRVGFQVAWLVESERADTPAIAPRWVIRNLREVLTIVNS